MNAMMWFENAFCVTHTPTHPHTHKRIVDAKEMESITLTTSTNTHEGDQKHMHQLF